MPIGDSSVAPPAPLLSPALAISVHPAMLRTASLLLAVSALLLPPVWARWQIGAAAREMQASAGWVCGTPMIGIVMLAALASALMALGGVAMGIMAFRRLPAPRPRGRKVELLLLTLPLAVPAVLVLGTP